MTVTAPYNFVPLSNQICRASELDGIPNGLPSQDVPTEGGLSGTIPFEISCDTPLLIGGSEVKDAEGKPVKVFPVAPDTKKPVIPGSSIRGMLRNVIEVASFARMGFVDNKRVGVRDLSATAKLDYGGKLSKVQAGWLRMRGGDNPGYDLTPCKFAQIKYTELSQKSTAFHSRIHTLAGLKQADERGAKQVESAFREKCSSVKFTFSFVYDNVRRKDQASFATLAGTPGTLVFTGLPGTSKGREFVFHSKGTLVEVPSPTWEKFIDVHEHQEKPSETWKWRRGALHAGESIPVFWLPDATGEPEQIGLAMMFKLGAENRVHDLIKNTSPDHDGEKELIDLPTRLFGRIAKEKKGAESTAQTGFKTRLSFGWASLTSGYENIEKDWDVVAAKPKPSFSPSYIRQKDFADASGKRLLQVSERTDRHGKVIPIYAQYRSYMNWPGKSPQDEQIRGWKRYPVRPPLDRPPEHEAEGAASRLRPITGNPLKFGGRIRFHNLHPIELGALVWALTWGGNDQLRHAMGMGKPFGWGRVKFTLADPERNFAKACQQFTTAMEGWAKGKQIPGGWENSRQIAQLTAMADPSIGAAHKELLAQMGLDAFADAKKEAAVLPEYPDGVFLVGADRIDPAQIKMNEETELSNDASSAIARYNAAVRIAHSAQPQPGFKKGEKVQIPTRGDVVGTVTRVLQDGYIVNFFVNRRAERQGNKSSERFNASDLKPLPEPQ